MSQVYNGIPSWIGADQDNILYVTKNGDDANSGLHIDKSKLTIQAAVTAASPGYTIAVYPGTYTETVTHAASNIVMLAVGNPNNVIITQADDNVVDFGAYTGIQYLRFGIKCTAATSAINTVQGSTGSINFKECKLSMVSSAAIVAVSQPSIGSITGAGTIQVTLGQASYAHTGACGATAQKGAFTVGNGGKVNLQLIKGITISNSGTALVSSVGIDTSSTGSFEMVENEINITDPNATLVIGLGYIGGTGTDNEFRRNAIHITATANTGYGIFAADASSQTRSYFNHIHVVDTGGASYGFFVGASATLTSQLDDIIAADGNNVLGTLIQANSQDDGDIIASGTITADNLVATQLDVEVGASGDPKVIYDINGTDEWYTGVDDDDSDSFKIGTGATVGTNTTFKMTADGERTMPLQPAFSSYANATIFDVTGDGTEYSCLFNTEIFDKGSNFSASTFTAPVTGKYLLETTIFLTNFNAGTFDTYITISTSNRNYRIYESDEISTAVNQFTVSGCRIVDMDAGDTANILIKSSGGTKSIDFVGISSVTSSSFAGSLLN